MKVFSAIWALKYLFNISDRRTTTHVHFDIHKMLNFPKHLFRGLKYLCRLWLARPTTPYESINPYGDKKAYTSQSDFYGSIMKLLYDFAQLRASSIYKRGISKPYWYMLSHLQNLSWRFITKTCLYNFDPLKPRFYVVKMGFTGVYVIFLSSAQNIDCGYSLEPPRRGGSNEYPQSMFWAEIWKISELFIWNFSFFSGKIFQYIWIGAFS